MTIPFQKEIYSTDTLKLFINISGVNEQNITNTNDFSLSIFAFDTKNILHIFSETLTFDQSLELYDHLNSLSIFKDKSKKQTNGFIEVTPDLVEILSLIEKVDSSLVKKILDKADKDEKLELIVNALTDSEIEDLQASIKQTSNQKAINDLKKLLDLEENGDITDTIKLESSLSNYIAGQPEKIFQTWIEKNIWTLGAEYINKFPARKIGIDSEIDLIMVTTDGFIDLIELKRPKFKLFSYDPSHKSYYPTSELSKAIGQCLQYLKIIDDYKMQLERKHKFKLLKPRVKLIIGRTSKFTDEELEALRMLNSNLNHIQIISYDYLVYFGENIISYYK